VLPSYIAALTSIGSSLLRVTLAVSPTCASDPPFSEFTKTALSPPECRAEPTPEKPRDSNAK